MNGTSRNSKRPRILHAVFVSGRYFRRTSSGAAGAGVMRVRRSWLDCRFLSRQFMPDACVSTFLGLITSQKVEREATSLRTPPIGLRSSCTARDKRRSICRAPPFILRRQSQTRATIKSTPRRSRQRRCNRTTGFEFSAWKPRKHEHWPEHADQKITSSSRQAVPGGSAGKRRRLRAVDVPRSPRGNILATQIQVQNDRRPLG